jgi:hypothetical protein
LVSRSTTPSLVKKIPNWPRVTTPGFGLLRECRSCIALAWQSEYVSVKLHQEGQKAKKDFLILKRYGIVYIVRFYSRQDKTVTSYTGTCIIEHGPLLSLAG